VKQAKAKTSKANDMLAKNIAKQVARVKQVQSRLEEISSSFGGKRREHNH
jgi:division protein CdvB (Snf7/Vps24/ESCRT-III family)